MLSETRPYQPNDWLLWVLPPVANTSNGCTICHINHPPVLLLRFQFTIQGLFVFGLHSENALLSSLTQKAVGAVRSLTPTSSPLSSPSKHGDRFIPSRAGANWSVNFHRINVSLLQYSQDFTLCPTKSTMLSRSKCWLWPRSKQWINQFIFPLIFKKKIIIITH